MASRASQAQSEPDRTLHVHGQACQGQKQDKPEPGQARQGMITQDYGQLGPGIGQSKSSQDQSGPRLSQVRARPKMSHVQATPDEFRARHGNLRLTQP